MEFSTDDLAPEARFESWRRFGVEQAGVDIVARDPGRGFRGAFRVEIKGPLARFRTQSDATRVRRGRREIGRAPKDAYFLYREFSEGAEYDFGGRSLATRRGSLLVGDLDQPFATAPVAGAGFDHGILYVPKALLDPYLPARIGPFARMIAEGPGLAGLAASAVDAFWREWDDLPEAATPFAADTLCRLVGLALGAAPDAHADAARSGQLALARRYVDAHLADPDLSAERTAAALRISTRSLYALFEGGGTPFAAHVRRRRLEECRAALLAYPCRPVGDIALAWGFGSMPSFYRAFQTAFGLAPSQLRETAAAERAPARELQKMRRDPAGNEKREARRRR